MRTEHCCASLCSRTKGGGGSRRPLGLGAQRRDRLLGVTHDPVVVEHGELAGLAQDAAVHDHGVDICRLRQRDERFVGSPTGAMLMSLVRMRMMSARLPGVSEP